MGDLTGLAAPPGGNSGVSLATPVTFRFPGLTNVQQVMPSPPTVAISTTNPAATGQQYVVGGASQINLSNFSITGAGNPVMSGTVSPDNGLVSFHSVTATNGTTQNGSNLVRVAIVFQSSQAAPLIVFALKGLTGNITAKVNDQYVSLTPTAVPNNGAVNYYSLTFAAAGTWRIEIIADNVLNSFHFGGAWTGSKTDTVSPAQIRGGKRIIVMGDSITSATGAGNQSAGYVQIFSEYTGYDDVWPAGVGGTGLINAGSSVVYSARVQSDVIAFKPDEVIIAGFYNDNGSTGATFQAALLALVQTIQSALPTARIWIFGPYAPYGVGYQAGTSLGTSAGFVPQRAACQNVVAQLASPNVKLLDPNSIPFYTSSNFPETPVSYTLTASASAAATSLSISAGLTAGANYQFADGSRFRCLSSTGTTATIDKCTNAQANGTSFSQCGAAWLQGTGKSGATTGVGNADNCIASDGVHPVPTGHLVLGVTLGRLYLAGLSATGEG